MGYTHYIRQPLEIPKANWDCIIKCVKHLFETEAKGLIQYEYDENKPPVANEKEIRFNGIGDDGHETFYLTRGPERFSFCKTARKPYDKIVCAVLNIVYHYAGDYVEISSDGEFDEWEEGNEIVQRLFGFSGCPIKRE